MVRISPSGGRTRRSGGAVSLAGGDVPIVTPASDTGVNVLNTDVTGLAFKAAGSVLDEGTVLA